LRALEGMPFGLFMRAAIEAGFSAKNSEVQQKTEEYSRIVLLRFMLRTDEPKTEAYVSGKNSSSKFSQKKGVAR
jgi:hypothetical protein